MVCTVKNCFSTETVRRLTVYLQNLKRVKEDYGKTISSKEIAKILNVTPEQFRKDLSYFGEFGKRGVGYEIEPLINVFESILGVNRAWNVAVIGAGRLGSSLLNYPGFADSNINVSAAFDINEDKIGRPLSPYAVTKYVNELYADVFARTYGLKSIGLRYFNVFGKRQDPHGAYAAVIPLWFASLITGTTVYINGDGETSRDFCYIDNCVQANILAAVADGGDDCGVYNIAFGWRTTLNELFYLIRERVGRNYPKVMDVQPEYRDFRPGDVRHSLADISRAKQCIGYEPQFSVTHGLDMAAAWYMERG